MRSKFVVGADGGRSGIRQLLNVTMLGETSSGWAKSGSPNYEVLDPEMLADRGYLLPLAAALVRSARSDAERSSSDEVCDSAEIIRRAAEQADRLIQDLLDVSHIEAGSLRIHVAAEDMSEIIGAACDVLAPFAVEKSVDLRWNISGELPLVSVDAARVHQVIWNIAGNAIKFTPAGGQIVISIERQPAELIVAVSDTGPGLPLEQVEKLTDRRWQATRQTSGGSGLGIVIAKGIVEAHGGRLWAESRPGAGSVFRFSLPIYEVAPA